MEKFTLILLAALLIVREFQNWREKKDLMDRIMAASFIEYKRFTRPRPAPGGPVNLTDAEMAKAEQERKHA
jgi:hypothetical protein